MENQRTDTRHMAKVRAAAGRDIGNPGTGAWRGSTKKVEITTPARHVGRTHKPSGSR
jgi:hypothetical protein